MKDTPDIKHPDYLDSESEREMYLSLIAGTKKIRDDKFLPKFPLESDLDYETRKGTATLLNVTKKTRDTLVGLVFQKEITFAKDSDKKLEDLAENIDNKGNHLNVFARSVFTDSFDGWACILADAPGTRLDDLGQQNALGIRPYLSVYKAANVTHWDYQINPVSKKKELSLIIFAETTNEKAGKFAVEPVNKLRAFYLENGRVYWELWKEQKNDRGEMEWVIETPQKLIDKLKEIPVSVVGELGKCPPLTDLAYLNIKYAQKESDYDSIIHKTCVPIPFTTGIDAGEVSKAQAGGVMWHLPEKATLSFAEVSGGSIEKARQNLEDLKTDMSWLGLRMLMPKPQISATATEAVIDQIQDTSELQVMATQLKDALEKSLGHLALLSGMKKGEGGSIELGCSWNQMVLSPQELQILNTMVTDGNYPLEYLLYKAQKAGMFPPDGSVEQALDLITEEQVEMRPVKNANAFGQNEGKTNKENADEAESDAEVSDERGNRKGAAVGGKGE